VCEQTVLLHVSAGPKPVVSVLQWRGRLRTEYFASICVCLLLQDLLQSCARGGRRIVEDMYYEIRRAEACVD
jgi:hypothetical protein